MRTYCSSIHLYIWSAAESELPLQDEHHCAAPGLDHVHLLVAGDGRPPLVLILPDPLPLSGVELPPPYPSFHVLGVASSASFPLPRQNSVQEIKNTSNKIHNYFLLVLKPAILVGLLQ